MNITMPFSDQPWITTSITLNRKLECFFRNSVGALVELIIANNFNSLSPNSLKWSNTLK